MFFVVNLCRVAQRNEPVDKQIRALLTASIAAAKFELLRPGLLIGVHSHSCNQVGGSGIWGRRPGRRKAL